MDGLAQKAAYRCRNCGGDMVGDGYTTPYHCEFAEMPEGTEPDASPVYCDFDEVGAWAAQFECGPCPACKDSVGGVMRHDPDAHAIICDGCGYRVGVD